jgi:tetratricopeptide (TPR) repeat protein
MYDRTLQGYEKALGPDHPSTFDIVSNLAVLYQAQGQLTKVEAFYDRALQGKENALGPNHTSTLSTVSNLANLYSGQNRLNEAEAMYDRALQSYKRALGPDHTSTFSTLNNLANLYKSQSRLAEAEAFYNRVLQGLEKALGPDHTSMLDTVNSLVFIYRAQGQLAKADTLYGRALHRRLDEGQANISGSQLNDSEQDSGYASGRSANFTMSPEFSLPESRGRPAADGFVETEWQHDEIESVATFDNEFRSQANDQMTHDKLIGETLLRLFLVQEPYCRALCEKAFARMSNGRFSNPLCNKTRPDG